MTRRKEHHLIKSGWLTCGECGKTEFDIYFGRNGTSGGRIMCVDCCHTLHDFNIEVLRDTIEIDINK